MNLTDLETKTRALLNNPDTTELSNTVIDISWARGLDKYSTFRSNKVFYSSASLVTVAAQKEYSVPSETIWIGACRLYNSLTTLANEYKYFEDYEKRNPGWTGQGDIKWYFENNQLNFSEAISTADAGLYIGLLLHKAHVFTAGACTTIQRSVFEGSLLNWVKGDLLETWAGYQGDISYGSARESRENIRREGQRLKAEAEKEWAVIV